MHAKGRVAPHELHAFDGTVKDLKTMPPDFAQEVERLWVLLADTTERGRPVYQSTRR